ncbi:predicted protein [Uncinocarpus reesii 1704]|uniref:Aminoglycoside phosphotransferase domain-containing protein n=1 Tax=Uncinocarpus reesii (strain UAMH 1704) TaxID=336963 RepID=C4JTM8_UNCRE|nr:uncharacterized protein UREG_05817 [Uncinocarpus reesii 1704]EEP80975.1 predicted protein [Uncinocarpus reesii 1704]
MDTNALVDLIHEMQGELWVDKINKTHGTGQLCPWVSTFHPDNLPCHLDGTFYNGAFNAGMKMVFSDGTPWMVRFPDEKVAMEVATLDLIHKRTTVPVPRVHAWGPAASNRLGLGPFIMMSFIDGVSLSDLLSDPNASTRLIREDIDENDIEVIYRQMANYLLQLFKLDFDCIGSLPWPDSKSQSITPTRDQHQRFKTTTEYFQYVIGQDWEQLLQQPNSTVGCYNAQRKYVAFSALKDFLCDLIHADYDHGKFKLICDDLGLANLIVKSKDDLTVVGVVDLECSYIGPAQLFGSAPWWLLQDRPVNSLWDCEDDKPPKVASRYFRYLEIFIRVLEEEEAKGHEDSRELSSLVRWSQTTGAMWLHMLILSGFNDHHSFPFTQLRQHFGTDWTTRENKISKAELEEFEMRKHRELDEYDKELEKKEEDKALVDSGKMTKEEFIGVTKQ